MTESMAFSGTPSPKLVLRSTFAKHGLAANKNNQKGANVLARVWSLSTCLKQLRGGSSCLRCTCAIRRAEDVGIKVLPGTHIRGSSDHPHHFFSSTSYEPGVAQR